MIHVMIVLKYVRIWWKYGPNTSNDGDDNDSDGACDAGDTDDDNDGVLDTVDENKNESSVCQILMVMDVMIVLKQCLILMGWYRQRWCTSNDGDDNDSDGACNVGDD